MVSSSFEGIRELANQPSNGHMETSRSRVHFGQSHVEVKYLASGAYGQTHVAISRDAADRILHACIQERSRDRLCADLRSRLVVVKFQKGKRAGEDLSNEITFLTCPKLRSDQEVFTNLIDYHLDGSTQWLTLPFVNGGNLSSLVGKCSKDLSISFQWHVGLQLAQALAYLHFGITDTDNLPVELDWPMLYHGDVHTGNVLLRLPTMESFGNYPDAVLADFGRAKGVVQGIDTATAFVGEILMDYRMIGDILQGLFHAHKIGKSCNSNWHLHPSADCSQCIQVAEDNGLLLELSSKECILKEWVQKLRHFNASKGNPARDIMKLLGEFITVAKGQRYKHFLPLTLPVTERLRANVVSDQELLNAIGLDD